MPHRQQPGLSVIIPTYNEERRLPNLLNSLRQQTFRDFEVIVADHKSRDKTCAIAKRFGARIVPGGLPAASRNNGARYARAQHIVFIDADVTFEPTFLASALVEFDRRGLSVAGINAQCDSPLLLDRMLFTLFNVYAFLTQKIYPHAGGYCIFSTKRVHDAIDGFDERMTLADDANYVLRASRVGRFGILHQRIITAHRRLETEGRFGMVTKMVRCEFRRIFIGEPRNNEYHYFDKKHNEQHLPRRSPTSPRAQGRAGAKGTSAASAKRRKAARAGQPSLPHPRR